MLLCLSGSIGSYKFCYTVSDHLPTSIRQVMGISQETHGELLWEGYCSFWLSPLKGININTRIFMENHIKRAMSIIAGKERQQDRSCDSFFLFNCSFKMKQHLTYLHGACLPSWKYLF